MKLGDEKPWRDIKPDAQGFDEVRVITIPRYKESYLSGDEWRISTAIQFWRKGRLIHQIGWGRNIASAIQALGYHWQCAHDNGHAMFAGEDDLCDQEGCAEKATVTYRKLANYDRSGNKTECTRPTIRRFCDRHSTRGDCGLDDADRNYERIT